MTTKIINPILAIVPAISQASLDPFFKDLVKTGIKAEAKVPNTKTSKIKSGNLKAAKKRDSSFGSKKCARALCLTSPSTLEAIVINIMIVAAERTEL